MFVNVIIFTKMQTQKTKIKTHKSKEENDFMNLIVHKKYKKN